MSLFSYADADSVGKIGQQIVFVPAFLTQIRGLSIASECPLLRPNSCLLLTLSLTLRRSGLANSFYPGKRKLPDDENHAFRSHLQYRSCRSFAGRQTSRCRSFTLQETSPRWIGRGFISCLCVAKMKAFETITLQGGTIYVCRELSS